MSKLLRRGVLELVATFPTCILGYFDTESLSTLTRVSQCDRTIITWFSRLCRSKCECVTARTSGGFASQPSWIQVYQTQYTVALLAQAFRNMHQDVTHDDLVFRLVETELFRLCLVFKWDGYDLPRDETKDMHLYFQCFFKLSSGITKTAGAFVTRWFQNMERLVSTAFRSVKDLKETGIGVPPTSKTLMTNNGNRLHVQCTDLRECPQYKLRHLRSQGSQHVHVQVGIDQDRVWRSLARLLYQVVQDDVVEEDLLRVSIYHVSPLSECIIEDGYQAMLAHGKQSTSAFILAHTQ